MTDVDNIAITDDNDNMTDDASMFDKVTITDDDDDR